ncbi:nitric oxide associated protein 1 [Batrachochytrium dendrobatidis]|nr:nitric oxide associated protein 1 [Batrachochytrium dendrobatidis]KAK5667914.1 nitric oxide associated protein 1 [Batrachochytrium dendrobatidis]
MNMIVLPRCIRASYNGANARPCMTTSLRTYRHTCIHTLTYSHIDYRNSTNLGPNAISTPASMRSYLFHKPRLSYTTRAGSKPSICVGCGAAFQHHSPISAGYIPELAYSRKASITPAAIAKLKDSVEPLSPSQVKTLINASKEEKVVPICQRCHNLKHHNKSQVPATFSTVHSQFKSLKTRTGGLVVLIVDVYDLPCTLLPNLRDLVGMKNVIVAINKIDLIPKKDTPKQYIDWVRSRIQTSRHTGPISIIPISATKGTGIDSLVKAIVDNRNPNEDIYMVGATNVGKSSVINQIVTHAGYKGFLTTSNFAGTTIAPVPIPISSFGTQFFPNSLGDISDPDHDARKDTGHLIDTVGTYNSQQLTHFLASTEFQFVVPKTSIRPRKVNLRPGKNIWFGALVRLEIVKTKTASSFWFYGCHVLPIHGCRESRMASLWDEHAGINSQIMTPPYGKDRINALPPFAIASESRYNKDGTRIWLGGLGWIVMYGELHFRVWTPGGVGIYTDSDPTSEKPQKVTL